MSAASGLAASIRGSTESDTFDLAGQTVSTISTNVTNAFKEPFPLDDMIRITFVTGAGKLGRQKYDENAAKAVTSALRDLGFEDDRGASCVKECAGSFKLQHDTGKNLKTVVVFPKITGSGGSGTGGEGGGSSSTANSTGAGGGAGLSVVPPGSPEEMIAMSSKTVFQSMLKSRCPAWSQKKGCLSALTNIKTVLTGLEQKLMSGTALSDSEQTFFDSVSASALDEKQAHVKDEMSQQVDGGAITPQEKSLLLGQVNEKLSSMEEDITTAETEGKPKKVEKLKGVLKNLVARKEKLSSITTKGPHRLKHEAEITKLRTELEPLLELEEGAKGRLLSLKETQTLARKDDVLVEIEELESKSRDWFEEDESFQVRVKACEATWLARSKQKKKTAKKTGAATGTASAWSTTAASRPSGGGSAKLAAAKKKPTGKAGTGGVFGAMMMDSDSD